MKQQIIFIAIVLFFASCKKERPTPPTPEPEPQPNYYRFNGEMGANDNSTLISKDNNLIMCGNWGSDPFILKITKAGEQLWRNDFKMNNSLFSGIAELNNNIFVCGRTYRNHPVSKMDMLLVKTNSAGDTIWSKTYGGVEPDEGTSIIATSDGNLLIAGRTESFGAGSFADIYLVKVNTNGDTLWTRSYPDQDQEVSFHVMETKNGEYLVTGTNEDNAQGREVYLLKVSSTGQQVWSKKIGPSNWKWGRSTIELSNGNLLTCGNHTVNGYNQLLLINMNKTGTILWEQEYGVANLSEEGNSMKQNADGTLMLTGSSYDVSKGTQDIIVLKFDQDGGPVWSIKFGSNAGDSGLNLLKDDNGDNIITGNYMGGIFMTRVDNNGAFK